MTQEDFIRERLEELTREEPWGLEDFISSFVCATLEILDIHKNWPVLVKHKPEPAVVYNQFSTDSIIMQMAEKINWLSQQEYIDKFGTEPPTSPILSQISKIWSTHEDYDPSWA